MAVSSYRVDWWLKARAFLNEDISCLQVAMRPAALVKFANLSAQFMQHVTQQADSLGDRQRLYAMQVLMQILGVGNLLREQISLAEQSKAAGMPNRDWPWRGQEAIEKRVAVLPGPQAGRAAKEVGEGVPNRAGAKTLVDAVL